MVVPGIVDAVAGERIQNAAAVLGEQLAPKASFILDIHAEQIKQCHPLRVDVFPVLRCGCYCFMVLKAAPPLIVTAEQLDEFVWAIRGVVELAEMSPAFRTEAPGMPRRASKAGK
jgi:hypothetical protein